MSAYASDLASCDCSAHHQDVIHERSTKRAGTKGRRIVRGAIPVLVSSLALLRFLTMSLMVWIEPFLPMLRQSFCRTLPAVVPHLALGMVPHILKLPPTKNWRDMVAVCPK